MDVTLPNGKVIKGVPEGTSKEEIMQKAIAAGLATEADFNVATQKSDKQVAGSPAIESNAMPEVQAPSEKPEGSMLDSVTEPLQSMAGGAIGSVLGYAASMAEVTPVSYAVRYLTGQEAPSMESAEKTMLQIQEYFRSDPDTKRGEEALNFINKLMADFDEGIKPVTAGIAGVLAGMESALNPTTPFEPVQSALDMNRRVKESSVSEVLSEDTLASTGVPILARAAGALPVAGEMLLGAKMAGVKPAKPAGPSAKKVEQNRLIQEIQARTGNQDTAKFEVDDPKTQGQGYTFDENGEPIIIDKPKPEAPQGLFGEFAKRLKNEQPRLQKDKQALEAIKQGFDEGVIASIKASSPIDKAKMLKMTEIMKTVKKNSIKGMTMRPSDVAGNSLMDRVDHILKVNRSAGRNIDRAAKELVGEKANFDQPVVSFLNDLDDMGITIGPNGKPNFMNSDIEGVKIAENVVSNIINRMSNTRVPDAYDMHRLKKYIDEQVTWGKGKDGLAGKTEGILKSLRNGIDGKLDEAFPKYNKVNTVYAETIGALDALQDSVSGKKMDLGKLSTSKRLGGELRKLMSNYNSRISLLDSIEEIDRTAKKHKNTSFNNDISVDTTPDPNYKEPKFDDNLLMQALYVDELNRQFGTVARTSFQGEVAKGVTQAAEGVLGLRAMAYKKIGEEAEKLRGINDEGAFKAIENLLKKDEVKKP